MKPRPVRPNIYLPVVRFGVVVADWKYILCATLIGYLVPFFFRLKVANMENFAFSILTVNNGWSSLQQTKEQIERTLNDLIINAQPQR